MVKVLLVLPYTVFIGIMDIEHTLYFSFPYSFRSKTEPKYNRFRAEAFSHTLILLFCDLYFRSFIRR